MLSIFGHHQRTATLTASRTFGEALFVCAFDYMYVCLCVMGTRARADLVH